MHRFTADLLAARTFLAMLGQGQTTPVAQHHPDFEIYSPGQFRKTALLISGLALAGEKDPRLMHFARSMAASGLRVVVPILEGLKAYRFDPADQAKLLHIASRLRAESDLPLAVVAFSAGASLALTTAATPTGRDLFDPLLLFSPLYDLQLVWETLHNRPEPASPNTPAWDDYVWIQCVIAWRNQADLNLAPEMRQHLGQALLRYSVGMSTPEKEALYKDLLKPLALPSRKGLSHEGTALTQLSPRGKLAGLHSRVILLQSPSDTLLPEEQVQALFAELKLRPHGQTWLLNTPLLAHAGIASARHITDAFRLIHLLGELFV